MRSAVLALLCALAASPLAACSSSSGVTTSPVDDASTDADADADAHADAPAVPDASTPGVTGQACKLDVDCDPDGDFPASCYSMSKVASVCIAGPCDQDVNWTPCDQAKGYCLIQQAGAPGACVGACAFGLDGSWSRKCAAGVTCVGNGPIAVDASGAWKGGTGMCLTGVCTSDADCVAPSAKCQLEMESCTTTARYYAFPSKPGDACTVAAGGTGTAGTDCFCFGDAGKPGYCMTFCTVGGPSCGSGLTCSALLPKKDSEGNPGFAKQPDGLSGYCLTACTSDADCTAVPDAGWCDTSVAGSGVCRRGTKP